MAIKILEDKIIIGGKELIEFENGIRYSGTAQALQFVVESYLGPTSFFTMNRGPMQGDIAGYVFGGRTTPPTTGGSISNATMKFPFATSIINVIDLPNTTPTSRERHAGMSGPTLGVWALGWGGSSSLGTKGYFAYVNDHVINSDTSSGSPTIRSDVAGHTSQVHGYFSGGTNTPTTTDYNIIESINYSFIGSSSVDYADLTVARFGHAGHSSSDHGYSSGGYSSAGASNVIDKFFFNFGSNATDVGDLTLARNGGAGISSLTHGYTVGGYGPTTLVNIIDKFPFVSNANASDVGDISFTPTGRESLMGASSQTQGYVLGGAGSFAPPTVIYNIMETFPFANDANSTDIGNLSTPRAGGATVQD